MRAISTLILCAYLSLSAGTATAQSYFVSPGGDDGGAGTVDDPWRTLEKAAFTAAAGDTVYIMDGVYEERLLPQNSGSPGAYITFTAFPGASVTIDGANLIVPQYAGLVDLAGRAFIRISGLRIMNSNEAGILADGTSDIVLEGNTVINTASSGIGIWASTDVFVENNWVETTCTNGDQECITIAGTERFVVRGNTILDCRKEGICLKDGSSYGEVFINEVLDSDHVGIYVDAWDKHTFNINVHRNRVHGIRLKNGMMLASEQGGQLENVRVFNNISYDNAFDGIGVSACCPGAEHHPIRNALIVNNTVVGNGTSGWGGGIGIQDNPDLEGVVIRNNLCSGNLSFQIAAGSAMLQSGMVTADHNLIDGFRNEESEIRGDNFVESDPLFEDAAAFDFHLRNGSPAIDAASPDAAPSEDFDGSGRPTGSGFDIGAFERQTGTSVDPPRHAAPHSPWLWQNYPNPFSASTTITYLIGGDLSRDAGDASQAWRSDGLAERVVLKVYDRLGREVLDLTRRLHQGTTVRIDAAELPLPGLYFYQLRTPSATLTRAMLLVR